MRVLVVGSGGREHALAAALAASPTVDEVLCAPGNPGMGALGRCLPLDVADAAAVAELADAVDATLTIVGPEVPLVAGAVDAVEARGRLAFGPRADAARLEGSKAWMKDVLGAAGVPTARHASFTAGEEPAALAFLESLPGFYVVKTDGLAAGKGVVVTESLAEARDAVRAYLSGAAFGDAGRTLVVEEGLSGPELSLLVLVSADDAVALAPAQDFKRIGDGDAGPNTGGMGAYSPVPIVDDALVASVMRDAVEPTLAELHARDAAYRGVLYAGLMLTPDGP
ncbi:MAG TPA: phosphoribosylamine--glycine ligase, partial [Acidimicrobiia bacterium]|nr:phosphoribosylamine--glycine ligase [Acidimicrobiia bacterium]